MPPVSVLPPIRRCVDLGSVPVGVRFTRYWFAKYGTYTVLAHPHGSIYTQVRTANGRVGDLPNWEYVMKQLEDMTEPELRELTTAVLDSVKALLPPNTGFCVLFWPFGSHGVSQYGSNSRREDMIKALRECADRLEKRQDVPR